MDMMLAILGFAVVGMAMQVNMGDVLNNSQAQTTDMAGKAFTSQMTRQAIIADRKFDELDIEQSVANRYATTGKPNATDG